MNTALIGAILTAMGSLATLLRGYSRWRNLHTEIKATYELVKSCPEDSKSHSELLKLGDFLVENLVSQRKNSLSNSRDWGTASTCLLIGAASIVFSLMISWLWLKFIFWAFSATMLLAITGSVFPSKSKREKSLNKKSVMQV